MKRKLWILAALVLLVVIGVVASGCRDSLTQHNINLDGVQHGKKLYKGANNCTACHGITLNGNGPLTGCYNCHGNLWSLDEHRLDRKGSMHRYGLLQSAENCSECHGGTELKGKRGRPACDACHEDNWTELQKHFVDLGGAMHAEGMMDPEIECADCHGDNLRGKKFAPSCFQCHFNKWDIPADHTNEEHGYYHPRSMPGVEHSTEKGIELCGSCHGEDLKTGRAQSCYGSDCHVEGRQGFND